MPEGERGVMLEPAEPGELRTCVGAFDDTIALTEVIAGDTIVLAEVITGDTIVLAEVIAGDTIVLAEVITGDTIVPGADDTLTGVITGDTITLAEVIAGDTIVLVVVLLTVEQKRDAGREEERPEDSETLGISVRRSGTLETLVGRSGDRRG